MKKNKAEVELTSSASASFLSSRSKRDICKADTGHCCHMGELGICPFLRDDGLGSPRRWVCTLRERLGSWEAVHTDKDYLDIVGPIMLSSTGVYCGDWPKPGEKCYECGVVG